MLSINPPTPSSSPALAAGLLLVPHEDAYQCVRTCPGARGWGEAWAAGAVPSSCAEMAPQVVVWRAARASHGPRPATAGLCQSWWTRSCRTLSSRWRNTMAKHSYSIAIKDSRGLSELSEARNSCYVAIWTDSPPLFFIATPDRCR